MKKLISLKLVVIATAVIVLTSCGYQRTLRTHCHIGDTQTCDNLFGVNQGEIDENQNAQLSAQQKEIESLTSMIQSFKEDLDELENNYNLTENIINMLHIMSQNQNADLTVINQMLAEMNQELVDIEGKISYHQTRINALAIEIANLQNQDGVVETVYACGDAPNKFDEGILKMKSGKLIAYFESGSNRFLTELKPGSYRSTDYSPYCYFTVNSNNEIVNAQRR